MLRRLLILALMYLAAGSAVLWVHGSRAHRPGDPLAHPPPDPLDRRIPELRLRDVPLDAALRRLSEVSGVPIIAMWNRIDGQPTPRDTPITLNLNKVSIGDALDVMLELASPDKDSRLGYVLEDDAIVVSTARDAAGETILRVYDIRDLTAAEREFAPPPPAPVMEQMGTYAPPSNAELVLEDDLAGLVEQNIESDTWKDNGGSVGSIRTVRGGLVVATSADIHRQIEHFLRRMRAQLARP